MTRTLKISLLPAAILLGILIILAVLGIESFSITRGNAIYPQYLIFFSFLLVVLQLFNKASRKPRNNIVDTFDLDNSIKSNKELILFCLCWLLYPILLPLIGFIFTTTFTLFFSIIIYHTRHPLIAFISLLIFSFVFFILLKTIIYIPVPESWPEAVVADIIYSM